MVIQTVDFAIASNLEVDVHRLDFGNYTVPIIGNGKANWRVIGDKHPHL